jgi:hypothetical protein
VVVDDEQKLTPGATLLIPPAETARAVRLRATEPSRVVRVVCGSGHGLVLNERTG